MLWTDAPCVAYSVERDVKENREKKWPREILEAGRVLLVPRFARPFLFPAGFFRVRHDGLSQRGTTRSLYHGLLLHFKKRDAV